MKGTLQAILKKLIQVVIFIYLFLAKKVFFFPKRKGTLNYYDDPTHKNEPPNFKNVLDTIKKSGFTIEIKVKRYRLFLLNLIFILKEPVSIIRKKVMFGTWEKWGFESIIISRKNYFYSRIFLIMFTELLLRKFCALLTRLNPKSGLSKISFMAL